MDEKNKGLVIAASILVLGFALVATAILVTPRVIMGSGSNPAPVVVSGNETQDEYGGITHHDSMTLRNDLVVTDDASVGGDFALTGALGVTGNVTVTGTASLLSTLAVSSNATIGGTLGVTGNTTVTGTASLLSTLAVTGASTFASSLGVTGALTVTSTSNLIGAVTIGGGTAIDKHIKASATLNVEAIGNGSVTSSPITATGASVGDSVFVTRLGNWGASSSTINIFGVAGTNTVTLYFQNNSSTAVDLSEATYNVDVWSH